MDEPKSIIESFKDEIDKLREEYAGLGLNDEQILTAKGLKLSPEDIKNIKIAFKSTAVELQKEWDAIVQIFRTAFKSEDFKNIIESLKGKPETEIPKIKWNKKGKPLKTWQKNNFFQ